jgi:Raf kinase inhibitor-like YbhB/YbcL family protein
MRGSATHRLIAIPALVALLVVAGCSAAPGASPTAPLAAGGSAGPTPVASQSTSSAAASSSASDLPSATMSPSAAQSPTPEATMPDFALTSTAFEPGGAIPKRFTCDGEDGSPDLAWTGAPDGTGALVLLVDDPDARGWVHWIVLDMAGTSSGALARGVGVSPDAPAQGRNDFGRIGWGGPCPPSGTHRYDFTLYALAEPLSLPGQPDGGAVRKALDRANVLGKAVLEAKYQRGG